MEIPFTRLLVFDLISIESEPTLSPSHPIWLSFLTLAAVTNVYSVTKHEPDELVTLHIIPACLPLENLPLREDVLCLHTLLFRGSSRILATRD